MKNSKKNVDKYNCAEIKRLLRMTCFLSEAEYAIIDTYLKNNKINNRSRWLRETILLYIHKDMNDNYPTLFDEHDMRR